MPRSLSGPASRARLLALVDGRLEDAVAAIGAQRTRADTLDPVVSNESHYLLARALAYLGQIDAVTSLLDTWPGGRVFGAVRACWLAHLGRGEEARRIREEFGDISSDEDESHVIILVHLLQAAVLTRDEDTSRELSRRLAPFAGFSCARITCGGYGRLLGGAAALLGEPEKARGYYRQAIEAAEKIRFRPEIALTRLELAELLLEHYPDEKPEALQHLDFSIEELRAMKMQPALERALRHKGLLKA